MRDLESRKLEIWGKVGRQRRPFWPSRAPRDSIANRASRITVGERAVLLTIIAESFTARTYGFSFQSDCADGKIVQCGIMDVALADLADFHHVKSAATDAPLVLLLEIERLANAKYEAGRLEEDGGLLIRSTDLVRYGFQGRKKQAA
jgi:hypothetical protein